MSCATSGSSHAYTGSDPGCGIEDPKKAFKNYLTKDKEMALLFANIQAHKHLDDYHCKSYIYTQTLMPVYIATIHLKGMSEFIMLANKRDDAVKGAFIKMKSHLEAFFPDLLSKYMEASPLSSKSSDLEKTFGMDDFFKAEILKYFKSVYSVNKSYTEVINKFVKKIEKYKPSKYSMGLVEENTKGATTWKAIFKVDSFFEFTSCHFTIERATDRVQWKVFEWIKQTLQMILCFDSVFTCRKEPIEYMEKLSTDHSRVFKYEINSNAEGFTASLDIHNLQNFSVCSINEKDAKVRLFRNVVDYLKILSPLLNLSTLKSEILDSNQGFSTGFEMKNKIENKQCDIDNLKSKSRQDLCHQTSFRLVENCMRQEFDSEISINSPKSSFPRTTKGDQMVNSQLVDADKKSASEYLSGSPAVRLNGNLVKDASNSAKSNRRSKIYNQKLLVQEKMNSVDNMFHNSMKPLSQSRSNFGSKNLLDSDTPFAFQSSHNSKSLPNSDVCQSSPTRDPTTANISYMVNVNDKKDTQKLNSVGNLIDLDFSEVRATNVNSTNLNLQANPKSSISNLQFDLLDIPLADCSSILDQPPDQNLKTTNQNVMLQRVENSHVKQINLINQFNTIYSIDKPPRDIIKALQGSVLDKDHHTSSIAIETEQISDKSFITKVIIEGLSNYFFASTTDKESSERLAIELSVNFLRDFAQVISDFKLNKLKQENTLLPTPGQAIEIIQKLADKFINRKTKLITVNSSQNAGIWLCTIKLAYLQTFHGTGEEEYLSKRTAALQAYSYLQKLSQAIVVPFHEDLPPMSLANHAFGLN